MKGKRVYGLLLLLGALILGACVPASEQTVVAQEPNLGSLRDAGTMERLANVAAAEEAAAKPALETEGAFSLSEAGAVDSGWYYYSQYLNAFMAAGTAAASELGDVVVTGETVLFPETTGMDSGWYYYSQYLNAFIAAGERGLDDRAAAGRVEVQRRIKERIEEANAESMHFDVVDEGGWETFTDRVLLDEYERQAQEEAEAAAWLQVQRRQKELIEESQSSYRD